MPHQLEYIVKDALMLCDKGVLPMPFQPTYNTHVKMSGMTVATALDKQPIVNIPCFGACSMTGGQPCVPAPLLWLDTYKVKVKGQQTLLYKSKLPCSLGGQIEFLTSGQIPLPAEEYDSLLEEHGEETGGGWGWWDTAELIPVIGNVIGMVREAKKGNWGMVALNAAFLVVDVVTFGAGAAVTTPLKGGIKAAVKVGAKKGLQKATQNAVKLGTKAGTKQLTKAGAKSFGKAVAKRVDEIAIKHAKVCVFACFPAGTKVATEAGQKNIEEVRAGEQVWAYDEETEQSELKRVVSTMQREVDATVKIVLAEEEIETTAEHPFYTQAGWKDAADLSSNDRLRTREGRWQRIKAVEFFYEKKEVYNFEVEDWHTYFVGAWQWLVHNAVPCLTEAVNQILEIGLKPKFLTTNIKNLKGAGSDALAEIGKKVDNIATHLTNSDVTGAVRDILGKPVIINGKQYDHLGEVEEALSGLDRQLKKIKKGMTENTFKGDTYQEAERILADLSKQKDKITNILNKATKL